MGWPRRLFRPRDALDLVLAQHIVISLALGALIGMERQSHYDPENELESLGLRTFSLAALLGSVSVLAADVSPAIPYVVGAGYTMLVIGFLYLESRARDTMPGITTQVSALLVFVIGALVPEEPIFAAVVAVLVATILSVKDWTHQLVGNLTEEEVFGTLKFLLVSVVLLPLLPGEPVDPWGIYNLQELWFLVVLISGISFLGYFAIRFMGRDRGIALTGALGGLASSTAVTLAMCHRVSAAQARGAGRSVHVAGAFAVLVASGIMSLRVIFLVLAVSSTLAGSLWLPLVAMAIPGIAVASIFWFSLDWVDDDGEEGETDDPDASGEIEETLSGTGPDVDADEADAEVEDEDDLEITNPFELAPALKFGLLFVAIIGGVELARIWLGESSGTYLAAFLSGLANMDAISVALARSTDAGEVATMIATRGVVLGIVANSISKAAMSWVLGSRRMGLYVSLGLAPMIAVGLVVAFGFM